ncbi:hypothetical protein ACS0TY_023962 [Phlomoides rotata]
MDMFSSLLTRSLWVSGSVVIAPFGKHVVNKFYDVAYTYRTLEFLRLTFTYTFIDICYLNMFDA